jgi:hypothetical protein
MQQGVQILVAVFGPGRVWGVRGRGLWAQADQPLVGEGMQGVADGLRATTEGSGDLGRSLAPGAVQKNLAAAQGEGVSGAQPTLKGGPLGGGQSSDKQWGFHTSLYAPDGD